MEFELGNIVKLLKRRLLFIAALALAAVAFAWYVSYYVLKPEYEAVASLLVQGNDQQQVMGDLVAGQKLVTTYGEIIRSNRIAEQVVNRLQLRMTPEKLLERVKTRTNSESLITTVVVTDEDPKRATAIANGFAEAFNDNLRSIMGVGNILFLDRAKVPPKPNPVSPKPVFNMTVAFGLALIAGIGIAMMREMMDKKIDGAKDIELELQLPLLGAIGKLKPRKRRVKTKSESKEGAIGNGEDNAQIVLSGPTEIG